MLMHPRGQEPQPLTPTNAIAFDFARKEVMRKEEDEELIASVEKEKLGHSPEIMHDVRESHFQVVFYKFIKTPPLPKQRGKDVPKEFQRNPNSDERLLEYRRETAIANTSAAHSAPSPLRSNACLNK
jgi:hypothetical protein